MPSPFDGLGLAPERTGKCALLHPISRKPLVNRQTGDAAWIELYSWHSPAAQEHRHQSADRVRRLGRDMTAAESEEDMGAMLARLTVAWDLVTLDGTPLAVDCTYEMARAAYNSLELRWVRAQVIDFLNNEGNFQAPGPTS